MSNEMNKTLAELVVHSIKLYIKEQVTAPLEKRLNEHDELAQRLRALEKQVAHLSTKVVTPAGGSVAPVPLPSSAGGSNGRDRPST
jgi:hypothetical protein